ncbi:MAG TPA: NAD(P)/FAD-dependent oxidoreductase [Terriglobales bacterium]|nr:NAD(P)/FAD-dependent oxidoreductase [Terriglobales bacterium]
MNTWPKTAVIIGAGPAGLTAAFELLRNSDIKPIVLEKSDQMGGISRTVNYKGNRMDIGGHRFFSKSDRVMNWWFEHMPLETSVDGNENGKGHAPLHIAYQNRTREISACTNGNGNGCHPDLVMLVRRRKSRIYFLRTFFDYPITLSADTLGKLGPIRTLRIGLSYMRSAAMPIKNVQNLEQFFINRFGRELYHTFFKSYTEKVWGVPCDQISAEWGEQRIKGLSIKKTLQHIIQKQLKRRRERDIAQKETETSLIEQFLYPKYGPGQMWETVGKKVIEMGGKVITGFDVTGVHCSGHHVMAVSGTDAAGETRRFEGDYFLSTMPIKELVGSLDVPVPANVREVSAALQYRDFITVGLLLKKMKVKENNQNLIEDNWIYIQEPDVKAGRLQIFNNWSPHLVSDGGNVWVGVEYFCYEGDELWNKTPEEMADFAAEELDRIGIIDKNDVLDSTVIKMPKTYPAYFGAYSRFDEVRGHLDSFENLFLVGRNGMHRYNNQDHSMLTAMEAVNNILTGRKDKSNIWEVNTEAEYHEEKQMPSVEEERRAA